MASRRLQILQAIEAGLKTIRKNAGYNHDVLEVSRKYRDYSQVDNFIRCNVFADREDIEPEVHRQGAVLNKTDPLAINLVDYVKGDEDPGGGTGIIADKIEEHIEDVKKWVYSNTTLGLEFVQEFGMEAVDSYVDWDMNIGIVGMRLMVVFEWEGTTP